MDKPVEYRDREIAADGVMFFAYVGVAVTDDDEILIILGDKTDDAGGRSVRAIARMTVEGMQTYMASCRKLLREAKEGRRGR